MVELLGCPFCGCVNVKLHDRGSMVWVACIDCGLEAPTETGVTAEKAVEYWNARAPHPLHHAQAVRKLVWLETFADRGDGSKEQDGWEADSGFGSYYSIEQYFGSDSFGWQVKFEYAVIADHDDPDKAKETAQVDFERRVLALPSTDKTGAA